MAEPSTEIIKEFENIRNTVFKHCPLPLQKTKNYGSKEVKYFNGKIILAYLIKHYNKTDYKIAIFRVGLLIGIIYSSIPGLIRVYVGEKFHGEDIFSIIVTYVMYPTTSFLILATNLFFTRHNIDMRRRRFVLQQLGMMISPIQIKHYTGNRLLPVIDVSSEKTLHTWSNLRRVTSDYGRKYFWRHEIFLPSIMFVGTLCLVLLIDITLLHIVFSGEGTDSRKLEIFCFINFVILLMMTLVLLNTAGNINSEFGYHSHIVKTNLEYI